VRRPLGLQLGLLARPRALSEGAEILFYKPLACAFDGWQASPHLLSDLFIGQPLIGFE
jgi:hypothetical protein